MRVLRVTSLPDGFEQLLAESVTEGFGHLVRLEAGWADHTNRFDRRGEALFAAFVGDRLAGICGLNRDPYSTEPDLGRIRHLYVSPSQRRTGVGRSLVAHALMAAAGHFDALCLRIPDSDAAAFYEALGFVAVSSDTATHRLELPLRPG